jgi:sialidase-1
MRRFLVFAFTAFVICGRLAAVETNAPLLLVDVFVDSADGYPVNRIPAIVKTRSGMLLAFAEGRARRNDQSENKIIAKRSTDCGLTWSKAQLVAGDGANSLNNPTAVVVRETGRVILMFQRYPKNFHEVGILPGLEGEQICRGFVTYSADDGLTWSKPVDITASVKRPIATSIASGPGIGIELARGKHAGRIIMPFNQGPLTNGQVYAVYSDDLGKTWQFGETVACKTKGRPNEVQMAELTDGSILMNARNQAGPKMRKTAVSRDGGQTWSPAEDNPVFIEPTCEAALLRHSISGNPADDLLIFSNPASTTKRTNGTVRLSRDDGRSWPVSRVLYPRGFSYSVLVSLDTNTVGCLFERDGKSISFCRFTLDWLTAKAAN